MSGEDTKPDFYLQIKDKLGSGQTRAGAAWKNSHGGITIKLNPCVVLSAAGLRDCYLTLWPNNDRPKSGASPRRRQGAKPPEPPYDPAGDDGRYIPDGPIDDDIPF